jgi:hypothetical protein
MNQTHSELGISDIMFDALLELMRSKAAQGGGGEEKSSLVELISHTGSL